MSITRVKPAGWGTGDEWTSAQGNQMDLNTTYALDKRTGETDTLLSEVTIGDGGSISAGHANAEITASVSGARIAATTSGAKIRTETGGRIELADDDYPTLAVGHAGRTVSRSIPGVLATLVSQNGAIDDTGSGPFEHIGVSADLSLSGLGALVFEAVNTGSSATSYVVIFVLDGYLQDGATLASVAVNLDPDDSHAGLPARMPRLRVRRFTLPFNTSEVALHSGADVVVDSSANTAAYNAPHSVVATLDQNNVIDKTAYSYQVLVWNEGGTNAISDLRVESLSMTETITDLRTH